ncbi:hypothetical protein BTVI_53560 [Pitangus sulphuratus]|nr:hypothetical protein BTVI_53560 [Pitangus sulphuratus]
MGLMHPKTQLALLAARALMTHTQLAINEDPQVPFHSSVLQPLAPQAIHTARVALSQVQNPALVLVKLHMVGDCPVFSFVKVSLQDLPAFEGVNSLSQISIISKLAQYPFDFCIQVIYKDVEEHRASDGAMQNPTELGTSLPFSGGEYSHIKRGLGSLPAFVFIWTSTFTKPASNAARALLFAEYATQPFYGICPPPEVLKKCLALAVLWSLGILNGCSVKMAAWVQTVFTLLKMTALSVIAVGGIVLLVARQKESLARFEDLFGSEIPNASQVAEAFFQGLYAYGGWWSLNYMAEEMKNPSRNIPLTVMTAVPAVIVFYLLVNISYLTVLTPKEIVSSVAVAVTWADRVIPSVAWIIPLSVAVSIFGALNSSMFTLGRLSYAGSQSGHLPVLISMLNVHSCTPAPAMIFSTTIASIFIIPSDLITLTNYFGFSAWLMIGLTCASLIVLRYREPHLHRPYKESLNMGRNNTEKADNPGREAKEDDGQRRSIRQRKAVERYQAPWENLKKHKITSSNHTSPVRERDSCKRTKRSLSANSRKDDLKEVRKDHTKIEVTRKDNLNEVYRTSNENQMKIGTSLAGVEKMQIGSSVQFDGVGGLSDHISALKEMIILPLLYPDVFEILKFKPPRGCLFYGPPGTGKTLVARALANECSRGDRKVTFFMRSAADCMSKWVGESERQLRLVFEQAYQMRPSIIFFDEIDALAPTRSSKQDQVHSSVVGTLLTLMDGLASRGEVVVIGATNRLDSIDPALRRPGRFEREFRFNLPNKEARQEIFKIHTRDWTLKPSDNLLEELAEKCVGYCGADINALCVEAGLCALRRRYPQIHESDKRLKIDATSIKVTAKDFAMAMQKIVPASQRAGTSPGRALPPISKPLLENTLERILQALQRAFPHAELALKKDQGNDVIDNEESPSVSGKTSTHKISDSKKAEFHTFSSNPPYQPTSFRPRFLLVEEPGSGQAFDLAPAVIHALEKFPAYTLDLPTLFVSSTSQEETCSQLIREAQRTAPSIIYIPQISLWWEAVGPTLKAGFTGLLNNIPYFAPVLLLATSDVQHEDLPEEIKALFNNNREEVFKIPRPTCAERRSFFEDLIMKQAAEPPASKTNADSRVHRVTHARCSRVDEQPQVYDRKAMKIQARGVFVDYSELRQLLDSVVAATESVNISSMAKLYSVLSLCIYQHQDNADKTELVTAWYCDHLLGQPVPVLDQPLYEKPSSNIHPKPPLTELQAIPLGSVTAYHREESSVYLSSPSQEEVVEYDEVSSKSPVLQAEQTK